MARREPVAWPAPSVRKGEPWTAEQVAAHLGRAVSGIKSDATPARGTFLAPAGVARPPGRRSRAQYYWWSRDVERYGKQLRWPAPHPTKGPALTAAEVGAMLDLSRGTVMSYLVRPPRTFSSFPAPAGKAYAPTRRGGVALSLYWWWADVDSYRRRRSSTNGR